ncbi:Motility protein B [Zhongshania aliphaticivorans]|uniref:Motility protein B n=1 Tax=Zhongshania aliphaticivorans TaxID=1470434 RepID=A0A5S9N5P5_9GAMM|nr:flagellar motor protein MotB [Zhongshania aliphaticivorans]CAA0082318.1 Motility protein B [Zhongshania aliphaticivorans]CAA0084408.1 Motility protein B [Zhongshania aliphaticivorans]
MEDVPAKKPDAGAPAWVLTFADLMSLLLAFFVLLFSFSEMDKQKFKELSGSMKDAFGVQRELPAFKPPIGTSMIARDFTPGTVRPTTEDQVRQEALQEMTTFVSEEADQSMLDDLEKVKEHLALEIDEGLVEVENDGNQVIIIRIRERGSFHSGKAELAAGFDTVIDKFGNVLNDIAGQIVVAGHTDNVPIHTDRFYSNWDLSSARAATVIRSIVESSGQLPSRFRVAGYADTRPIADNTTVEGRARNRRVEIFMLRGATQEPAMGSVTGEFSTSISGGE